MGTEASGVPGTTPSGLFPSGPPGTTPSGLFPSGPPRRTYREPHPVRPVAILAGAAAGACWLALFLLLGHDLVSRVWWTAGSGTVAWLAALALAWRGERGAGAGVAAVVALAWVAASVAVAVSWSMTRDWPLW